MNDYENKLRDILKKITKDENPDKWDRGYIFYPGEIDSLDMATFALSVEEVFDVKVSDEVLANMYSIENVLKGIKELKNESTNISS